MRRHYEKKPSLRKIQKLGSYYLNYVSTLLLKVSTHLTKPDKKWGNQTRYVPRLSAFDKT